MVDTFKQIADSSAFQNFITFVILVAGVLVGASTYPSLMEQYGTGLEALDSLVLWIFVAEIVVKMGAEGNKPWRYFIDPWNIFDFFIVVVCFLPFGGSGAAVLRLARLLRVLKLVNALPKLQVLVSALLKSVPSMGYISLLLLMLFYMYAVAATMFFGGNDPIHFESLELSMLSLFRVVTLEDWTDVMYINMYGCANYGYDGNEALCTESAGYPFAAAMFFVTFVLSGTMVILNLFVGVIMTGMDEAKAEIERDQVAALRTEAGEGNNSVELEVHKLREQIAQIDKGLEEVLEMAAQQKKKSA